MNSFRRGVPDRKEGEVVDLTAYEVSENDAINVSVTLCNTGDYDGDEIVQLYVRDVESAETQPIKSLKGF